MSVSSVMCASDPDAKSQWLATFSHAIARKKIFVLLGFLKQPSREMNRRICTRNRSQLGNDLLECVFFRKHVEKISPLAYHMLDSFGVQEVLESNPVNMAISIHFEDKIIYVAKAKAAVPP